MLFAPHRHEINDASGDPTKTRYLRSRMRSESDRRWQLLGRTVREALITQDILGLRGIGRLPHGDKADGFAAWLDQELQQKVMGGDGGWTRRYIQQAAEIAQRHAHSYTPAGQHDPTRVTTMENMTIRELTGITTEAWRQITRVVTEALAASSAPTTTANRVAGVIQGMRKRTWAMGDWMIARTHAATTLSIFRDAGVAKVGIIPEGKRKRPFGDAEWGHPFYGNQWVKGSAVQVYHGTGQEHPHSGWWTTQKSLARNYAKTSAEAFGGTPRIFSGELRATNPLVLHPDQVESYYGKKERDEAIAAGHDIVTSETGHDIYVLNPGRLKIEENVEHIHDAKRTGPGSRSRRKAPSARTVRRIRAAQRTLEEQFPRGVDVLTAEDENVCIICEDISAGGPYDLDEAEGLIPAHVYCRCAFVPAGTLEDTKNPQLNEELGIGL